MFAMMGVGGSGFHLGGATDVTAGSIGVSASGRAVDSEPISLAQRERLMLWQHGESCLDQPTYAWVFAVEVGQEVVRDAWTTVLSRFANLRTSFFVDSDETLTRRHLDTPAVVDQAFVSTDSDLFFTELCRPLSVLGGVLTRMVHAVDSGETMIGICFDHLVIDGHTVGMILTEFWGLLCGEMPRTPPPTSDAPFVARELAAAASPQVERDLDHWREKAGGLTYPPPFMGVSRNSAKSAMPETAFCEVDLSGLAARGRARMSRASALLSTLTVSLVRTLGSDERHFTTLTQGTRRTNRSELKMAGFLSTWLLARVPVDTSAARGMDQSASALMDAMTAYSVHHAEVVRRLEPHLYGARYRATENLPPYSLFNYQVEPVLPRLSSVEGRKLVVPPVAGNILHGGLRVYGNEHPDAETVTVRVVADASVFGPGFADAVAADLPVAALS